MKLTIPKIMIGGGEPSHYEILLPLPTMREGWKLDSMGGTYQLSFDWKKHVIVIIAPALIIQHDLIVSYYQIGVSKIITEKSWITNGSLQGVTDTVNFLISVVMGNGLLRPPAKSVRKKVGRRTDFNS